MFSTVHRADQLRCTTARTCRDVIAVHMQQTQVATASALKPRRAIFSSDLFSRSCISSDSHVDADVGAIFSSDPFSRSCISSDSHVDADVGAMAYVLHVTRRILDPKIFVIWVEDFIRLLSRTSGRVEELSASACSRGARHARAPRTTHHAPRTTRCVHSEDTEEGAHRMKSAYSTGICMAHSMRWVQ